ncbi:hypothetical protein ACWWD9_02775 [Methylovorus sp. SPW-M1]
MSDELNGGIATGSDVTVTRLLVTAFSQAAASQRAIYERWINTSIRVGGLLPKSTLMISVQSLGHLDMMIRGMENDFYSPESLRSDDMVIAYALTYQRLLSELWVGSAYEIARLLRARGLAPGADDFNRLMTDLELLRMPLEKHEIAKDYKLAEPLVMRRMPSRPDDVDFIYDKTDKQRAHIVPSGISERGSYMWSIVDIKAKTERWVEWRVLSDLFLDVFTAGNQGQ